MRKVVGDMVIYPELFYELNGIFFEVHNQLGPGFTEDLYEKAVVIELVRRNIPFERQKVVEVFL